MSLGFEIHEFISKIGTTFFLFSGPTNEKFSCDISLIILPIIDLPSEVNDSLKLIESAKNKIVFSQFFSR